MTAQLHHGDCRTVLAAMPAASVDAVVTDPPYELGFMGKRWDATGIAYDVAMWAEVLRVLKPGGHLLAFGGTRTYHRMACAIEDAGFEIRDSIHWLYGSGFPKSLDVSKAIDKAAGAERKVVGTRITGAAMSGLRSGEQTGGGGTSFGSGQNKVPITAAATDAARQWEGWGTALKPAHEPIVVARKPLDGTVAANVLQHGTGAINVDGCRVAGADTTTRRNSSSSYMTGLIGQVQPIGQSYVTGSTLGRWPANVVLSHSSTCGEQCAPGCPIAAIDQQADGASRFFTHADLDPLADLPFAYVAKPSRSERNAGLDDLPKGNRVVLASGGRTLKDGQWIETHSTPQKRANHHPTVKPLAIMRWLVRLVTPPDGTVLDPFAGSGTTLAAAILEHRHTIGIELTADYLPIINGRIAWAQQQAHHDRHRPHQETLDL